MTKSVRSKPTTRESPQGRQPCLCCQVSLYCVAERRAGLHMEFQGLSRGGSMSRNRGERGEGRLGTFFALTLLVVMIYLGFKVLPVMINSYAFKDFMEEEARFASVRRDDDEIRTRVYNKARELQLPITMEMIKTDRSNSRFDIAVSYSVPIVTPVYTYQYKRDEHISSPLF